MRPIATSSGMNNRSLLFIGIYFMNTYQSVYNIYTINDTPQEMGKKKCNNFPTAKILKYLGII
jgi:hypothetical protein